MLYAARDSVYKTITECEVWDVDRDARGYRGWFPVVAHPPCRAWSVMRSFAKPLAGERDLGPLAVEQVRAFGGVLEHPYKSDLWRYCRLPAPGKWDAVGFTFPVHQFWWGHKAEKATLLYFVGVHPSDLPPMPLQLGEPAYVVGTPVKKYRRPGRREIPKRERSATPPAMADWLVRAAALVYRHAY